MSSYRLSPVDQITDLRSISETISDYLDRDLYIEAHGVDAWTVTDILQDIYALALSEIRECGIVLNMDESELFNDFYTAKYLYYLLLFCQVPQMIKYLSDPITLERVESALQEPDNFFIQQFYTILMESPQKDFELEQVGRFFTLLTNQEKYPQYISQICKRIRDEGAALMTPETLRAKNYIQKIQDGRRYAATAATTIAKSSQFSADIDESHLQKLIRDYDLDKISPEDIAIYSVVDSDSCPDTLYQFKEKKMYEHHLRSSHHPEYWLYHKDEAPTMADLTILVAHLYEPNGTPEEFHRELEHMLQRLSTRFSPDQISTMQLMGEILMQDDPTQHRTE